MTWTRATVRCTQRGQTADYFCCQKVGRCSPEGTCLTYSTLNNDVTLKNKEYTVRSRKVSRRLHVPARVYCCGIRAWALHSDILSQPAAALPPPSAHHFVPVPRVTSRDRYHHVAPHPQHRPSHAATSGAHRRPPLLYTLPPSPHPLPSAGAQDVRRSSSSSRRARMPQDGGEEQEEQEGALLQGAGDPFAAQPRPWHM